MRRAHVAFIALVLPLTSATGTVAHSQAAATRVRTFDRARLERILGTFAASSLKVVRTTGVTAIQPTDDTVRVVAGDFVFRKIGADVIPEPGVPTTDDGRAFQLPYRWFSIDTSGVERLLIPRLIVYGNGLSYDRATRMFRGKAMIGVEDSINPSRGSQPLARPLRMQITLGGPGEVIPNKLAIDHTSLDYDSIFISARDSVTVRIQTATDPNGVLIPVQVYRPIVKLSALPSVLQAFGLGTSAISVALPPGYSRIDTITVRLQSRTLNIRPPFLRVTADGANEAKIRSGSPGQHTVSADVDGMTADSTEIAFVWPWLFLSAALAGIITGGAATFFGNRAGKPGNIGIAILKGAPFGFLTAVAAALGLDLLGLHLDDAGTWMGVMLTAALGAYAGERILERFVNPTSPGPK